MQCDPHCSEYKPCISACGVETCDNLFDQGKSSRFCAEDTCVEGCHIKPCPEGQIYANDSYVDCVPKSICKPVCLSLNGIDYFEGDVIKSDNCQTCRCSKGKEVCIGMPCTATTILPIHVPAVQDASANCLSGWSEWINQERMSVGEKANNLTKFNDYEPLPNAFMLKNYKNSAYCDADFMSQIECRSVDSHLSPKVIGEDAECSLEKGLVCEGQCHDYETRVFCNCDDQFEIITLPSYGHTTQRYAQPIYRSKIIEMTTATPSVIYGSICNPAIPHVEKPGNCHDFYHCTMNTSGAWVFVDKTCGKDMMFNPQAMICDHIDNVKRIKPQCGGEWDNTIIEDISVITKEELQMKCPVGQTWSECAVPCGRACHFYDKYLQQSGLCTGSWNTCEKGCVPEMAAIDCGPGYYWRDDKLCVKKADCTCRSDDGKLVKVS